MPTSLKGHGIVPHRPRKSYSRGLFITVDKEIATAIKKLALSMDVSCASVANAILRKSLKL
jgi:hypothetical protein